MIILQALVLNVVMPVGLYCQMPTMPMPLKAKPAVLNHNITTASTSVNEFKANKNRSYKRKEAVLMTGGACALTF